MKIRQGFVSNSSSSSFICGSDVTVEEATKVMEKLSQLGDLQCKYEVFTADKDYGKGWDDYYPEMRTARREKRVIVQSVADNSIAGELLDLVETLLDAKRYHLG